MSNQNGKISLTYMLDCSRNAVASVPALRKTAGILKTLGYTGLSLYCENTYKVQNEPYFGYLNGAYTEDELRAIDALCADNGLEFSMSVQTLAHMRGVYRFKDYYQEAIDCNDVLLVGAERTYALIDNMFATLSRALSSKTVNIGMDEPKMLGRGKYLDKNGYKPRRQIFAEHLKRVLQTAQRYGLRPLLWGDFMFGRGGADDSLTRLVREYGARVVYWDYGDMRSSDFSAHKERIAANLKRGKELFGSVVYAGGDWKWIGLAPHNGFALKTAEAALEACADSGVTDIMLTSWGDTGAEVPPLAALPVTAYYGYAARGAGGGVPFAEFFNKEFGSLDDFMKLDLANNLSGEPNYRVNSSSKYLLFADPFLGFTDKSVKPSFAAVYDSHLKKLEAAKNVKPQFGYLFAVQRLLIEALRLKFDLGARTRAAYRAHDGPALKSLADNGYKAAAAAVRRWFAAFRRGWLADNKPFGLEVHEARVGALLARLGFCAKRLKEFADGKTESIPELDCDILDEYGDGENIVALNWGEFVSAGTIIEYNSFV
ncbi:MAG: hypothetical protein LBP26_04635 [Clostridiales bacterium]|jgi:hypothetical protein|nr:hypothetical protein [Clostridiales bacterium]